jgi:DNA modification methylase
MSRDLKSIFIAPPISVLDVKQKYWKDQRKMWLGMGIQSEVGRNSNLLKLSPLMAKKQKSTSVFDPVVCNVMYLWFTNENDTIYDPFAGGSVRGIVAGVMNRQYIGVDIRQEQIESNHEQLDLLNEDRDVLPQWICGDANEVDVPFHDFFFTCPPYHNLEIYSDDPKDISNMSWDDFLTTYESIITRSLKKLHNDRFAAIVVSDVRNKEGNYAGLNRKTIEIFEQCGCYLYNEMILLQEPATAAMRAFNYMNTSRKIAKCHQYVYVFIKGDANKATARLPKFEG